MRPSASKPPQVRALRCAIYTRVSTEHGLEQEFNSLDNQREAAEAYIKSQSHEGWRLLLARYDDGGYSGGTMDRPGLRQLLADIQARLIDVVVVYKVDRLTRSLADFAKLVELFDQHGVSFVSVTQSFNTTSSMGRLTLNVLLSFAQFEREVTGERIRDKIAASKKKGLRVGGPVPLGYEVRDKRLVVHEREADEVRLIFRRYLELGCVTGLARDLRERGILTKVSHRRDGTTRGGISFTKGPLAFLLRNRAYIGEVVHKGQYYRGEHEPILSPELFEAVQQALSSRAQARAAHAVNRASLLMGRLFDDRGNRMTPSSAKKGGARYRYYVSCVLAQGRKEEAGMVSRVPAPEIEALVLGAVRQGMEPSDTSDAALVQELVERVEVRQGAIVVSLRGEDPPPLVLPWSPPPVRRKRQIVTAGEAATPGRPIRAEAREKLVGAIARARLWLAELVAGEVASSEAIAEREGLSARAVRMTLSLAFLAPDLVRAAVEGTLPRSAGVSSLADLPLIWGEQWHAVHGASDVTT